MFQRPGEQIDYQLYRVNASEFDATKHNGIPGYPVDDYSEEAEQRGGVVLLKPSGQEESKANVRD